MKHNLSGSVFFLYSVLCLASCLGSNGPLGCRSFFLLVGSAAPGLLVLRLVRCSRVLRWSCSVYLRIIATCLGVFRLRFNEDKRDWVWVDGIERRIEIIGWVGREFGGLWFGFFSWWFVRHLTFRVLCLKVLRGKGCIFQLYQVYILEFKWVELTIK